MKLFISSYNFENCDNLDNSALPYRIPCIQFKENGWTTTTINELPILTLNNIKKITGEVPTVILIWLCGPYIEKNYLFLRRARKNNFGIKFCWYIDDLHCRTNMRNNVFKYVDIVLNSYMYCFHMFYDISLKKYWFPHYINEKLLKNITFNSNPEIKILLSGQIKENIYPARYKALALSKKNDNITVLCHPGYKDREKHSSCGSAYYDVINNNLAAFTCCASEKRPYIVSKFFEIIACGTLLIAYDEHVKEPLNQLGFIENENYISCNLENMENVFEYVLDPNNRKEIDRIRSNGFEFSKKSFLCNRVKDFCEYIDEEKYLVVR